MNYEELFKEYALAVIKEGDYFYAQEVIDFANALVEEHKRQFTATTAGTLFGKPASYATIHNYATGIYNKTWLPKQLPGYQPWVLKRTNCPPDLNAYVQILTAKEQETEKFIQLDTPKQWKDVCDNQFIVAYCERLWVPQKLADFSPWLEQAGNSKLLSYTQELGRKIITLTEAERENKVFLGEIKPRYAHYSPVVAFCVKL